MKSGSEVFPYMNTIPSLFLCDLSASVVKPFLLFLLFLCGLSTAG